MHIAVLGSASRTGQHVEQRARAAGHSVLGLQRQPAAGYLVGDACDPALLRRLVHRADAVLVVLGPSPDGPPDVCSRATETLVKVMHTSTCRRLICLTSAMVGHPRQRLGWVFRTMESVSSTLQAELAERRGQEDVVRDSGLGWTLVHPGRLVDGPPANPKVGEHLWIGPFARVSRATLAAFLIDAIEPRWIGRAVAIRE
jgi:nucleoside-diphosphate-sugar epimerase